MKSRLNTPENIQIPGIRKIGTLFTLIAATAFSGFVGSAQEAETDDEVYELEDFVVVSGIKESLLQGVDFKKDSYQMVDVIIAEDIGKFPDNNVVEALQRVSGIQTTDRAGGEVNTVTIRGLNDVTTTINGRDIFTASGRSVALADIPAALLNRVDVYKTRSSDLIESGIAGVIDVKTQRPFYFDGFKSVLAARYTYMEQSEEWDPNISAMISNTWDLDAGKFGALFNISFAKTHYRDQWLTPGAMVPFMTDDPAPGWVPYERIFLTDGRVAENPIWEAGLEAGLPFNEGATLAINGVQTPVVLSRDAIFQSQLNGVRDRPAMNVSLQFAPEGTNAEYTFEAFYNGYRNKQFNSLAFSFVDWWGNLGDHTAQLYPGTNIVKSRQNVKDVYAFMSGDQTKSQTDSYLFGLTGKWEVSDNLNMMADLTYQTSEYETEFFAMRADGVRQSISVDFNDHDGVPSWDWGGNDPENDPSGWNVAQLYDNGNRNKGSALNFVFKGDWTPEMEFVEKVSFGVRFDNREASEAQRTSTDFNLQQSFANFSEWQYTTTNFFDGNADVPTSWVVPNGWYIAEHKDEVRQIYNAAAGAGTYLLEDELSLTEAFNITEKNYAAFVQADFSSTLGGNKLDGQVGARFVQYDTDMNFIDLDTLEQSSADSSKSKVLPSLTLRYDLTDNLRARFSYGQTIRRPNFTDLNATINYVEDVTNIGYGTASGGNPDLDPTESTNYDFGLEYYMGDEGMIYGTWFKREIEGLVVDFRSRTNYEGYDYIMSAPGNASDGELSGFEFGFVYFPENLPDILDGFGIQASYTILDSEQTIPITNDAGEVIAWDTTPFFAVSDTSYSVVLAYEKEKFSARLSYVWRDDFLYTYEAALFANPLGIYQSPEESMDFQFSYNVTEDFVITLDATNLTEALLHRYYEYPETHNFNNALFSRTISLGMRYSF